MNTKKKKLLVTGSTFPRWEGDTEPRFVLDLSEALTEYFDVTALVPAAPGAQKKEEMNGVHIIRYHYFPIHQWETLCYPGAIVPRIKEKKIRILLVPFLFISLYIQLAKRVKDYDIVHAHWLIPQGIVQSFFHTPYIVTGHGGDVTSLNKGILKTLKRRTLERAGHITAVSGQLERVIQQLYPNKKLDIISMGCKTKNFSREYRVENYFNQNSSKVILFVGRLAEKKGVSYLLKAIEGLDAKLVIVGDGPMRQELEAQACKLGDQVTFLGAKNHEELKTIFASADIFVAPSITAKDGDKEGIPTAIMEAMASGLPVIASDSGGIAEIITDGVNGYLTKEKDVKQIRKRLVSLLEDDELREELSKKAELSAKELDYSVIGRKYAAILNEVLEKSNKNL